MGLYVIGGRGACSFALAALLDLDFWKRAGGVPADALQAVLQPFDGIANLARAMTWNVVFLAATVAIGRIELIDGSREGDELSGFKHGVFKNFR